MKFIKEFFLMEEKNKNVSKIFLYNGVKYIINDDPYKERYYHAIFNPLTEGQINNLQDDVNEIQKSCYVFPDWYRIFLKTCNGMNLYFNSISLYGDSDVINDLPKYNDSALLYELNKIPNFSPYNLRYTNSIKFYFESQNRWLVIGCYKYDGTQIVWDYKKNKIEAMYALPATTSYKKLMRMTEEDYENMIICEWSSFDEFLKNEMKRLSKVFSEYTDLKKIKNIDIQLSRKTLPIGHREYIK